MARKKKALPVLENVEITGVAAEGKAFARVNEMVVFVPFVVPGDVVDLQIVRKKHSYAEATVIQLYVLFLFAVTLVYVEDVNGSVCRIVSN